MQEDYKWFCDTDDILRDIKVFMRENYTACTTKKGKALS